jgi:hypothetical protein
MNNDDIDIDSLLDVPHDAVFEKTQKKKKKNGCVKGKVAERDICHELESIFKGDIFRRVPSSGAFMGGFNYNKNMHINDEAKRTLTGDIITPTWMKFSLESKAYDDTPMFHKVLCGEDKDLDKWIKQATDDAAKVDKRMLLLFKITSKRKAFACLEKKVFDEFIKERNNIYPDNYIVYKNTHIIIEKPIFMENYLSKYKNVNDWFYNINK